MKIVNKKFLLLISVLVQTIHSASMQDLNNWFKRVKKGTQCLIKREPCNPEDTRAMYQAIGAISASLVLVTAGAGTVLVIKKIKKSADDKQTLKRNFFNDVTTLQANSALLIFRKKDKTFQKELAQYREEGRNEPMILVALNALKRSIVGLQALFNNPNLPEFGQNLNKKTIEIDGMLDLISNMLHSGATDLLSQEELKSVKDEFIGSRTDLLTDPKIALPDGVKARILSIGNHLGV